MNCTNYHIEVCIDCIESLEAALKGGATRIELCAALSEGGLTPSMAFIHKAVSLAPKGSVFVMIRPRMGDFLYSREEQDLMLHEIELLQGLGIGGIVLGALTADGEVDINFIKRVQATVHKGIEITFHRAFDVCRDPYRALEQLADLGVQRILTSGCAPSALEGAETLYQLGQRCPKHIRLIVAGGVGPQNIKQLRDTTKAQEFHLSAKSPIQSSMRYRNENISMGRGETDEYLRYVASQEVIRQVCEQLYSI